jgi:seryl-tRNA synthetase
MYSDMNTETHNFKSAFGKRFMRSNSPSPSPITTKSCSGFTTARIPAKNPRLDESDQRILQNFEKMEEKHNEFSKKFYSENLQMEQFKNEKMRAEMEILKQALNDGLKSLGIIFQNKNKVEGELLLIKL